MTTTTTTDPMDAITDLRKAGNAVRDRLVEPGELERVEAGLRVERAQAALDLIRAEETYMLAYYAALVVLGEKEPIDLSDF